MIKPDDPRIIIALDFPSDAAAFALVEQLDPRLCRLKVGMAMFTHYGPLFLQALMQKGFEVFLDLKFHDIPNQVAMACRAASELGVWMFSVHALGGSTMLKAAFDAIAEIPTRPRLVAVTILTSTDEEALNKLFPSAQPGAVENRINLLGMVGHLARLSYEAKLDGVVCSGEEAAILRAECGEDFLLVTPGIRLEGEAQDDQKRTLTPAEAVRQGADYLVIGRPITESANPAQALLQIVQDLENKPS
jgi:orotidine-5'-phosphate decarboxylase